MEKALTQDGGRREGRKDGAGEKKSRFQSLLKFLTGLGQKFHPVHEKLFQKSLDMPGIFPLNCFKPSPPQIFPVNNFVEKFMTHSICDKFALKPNMIVLTMQ